MTRTTFEYFTNADFLRKETVTLDGVSGSFATEYTYDYDGRLLTAKYPSGRIVTETYDSGGGVASDRLASLTDSPTSATLVQAIQDNAAGQITNRTLSTGIIETRTFNPRNQLQRIAASANSATLLDISYGYGSGNNGRIRSRTDAVQPEHSANYTFDEIGRLKEVSGGDSSWGISWGIDRYGNRTSQSPSGLASGRVGSQSLGYTNNKNTSFTYDDAGNLIYDGTNHFYYDAENRLYQVDSSVIQYAYDSEGRRIKKTVGGVTTYYFYGLTGLMSEFSTASGPTGAAATDRLQYRIGEQTGTAVMLMASDGTPRENNRVFPFGEPWLAFVSSNNNEKFTTYQHDNETDLDYAMARFYASRSGRFLTPDPSHVGATISDPQSWNAYVYVGNDPINSVDPTGLCQYRGHPDIPCPEDIDQIITVTAPLEWEPCVSIENGEETGACVKLTRPAITMQDLNPFSDRPPLLFQGFGNMFLNGEIKRGATQFAVGAAVDLFIGSIGKIGKLLKLEKAAKSGPALARELGAAGEEAAQIVKNTKRIPAANGSYRIPDVLDAVNGVIGEVKNVKGLSYSAQLRDYAAYAARNGYQFELYVRRTTKLSGPLQDAISNGTINLRYLPD